MPFPLKKNTQSGFTLIELMVVMAIIAILATAGLSAYTGYIKKARDAVRIADIDAINKIVLASMSTTGIPPRPLEISALVTAANNGVRLWDPLSGKNVCTAAGVGVGNGAYNYFYRICDGGTGYVIMDRLESASNASLLSQDASGVANNNYDGVGTIYDIGSCQVNCTDALCGTNWSWVPIH